MSSSENRSSRTPVEAPPAATVSTRPTAPSERERRLLERALSDLSDVAMILRAAEERLCHTAAALHAFEPAAAIVAVGEEPYSEVAFVASDLADCIASLQSAREDIDPAGRPSARAIIADLVLSDRRSAERSGYRAAESALAAFDAGDSEAAIAGAAEFARLLELADSMTATAAAPAASPDLLGCFYNDTPQG